MDKQRLFVDMDGTLAVFKHVSKIETLYEKDYFSKLQPIASVVNAVKGIIKNNPEIEVHILSSVLSDSKFALDEKNQWLDKYLPDIDMQHRIFPPCGADKKEYIPGGVRQTDFLLDDYTNNLTLWEPPAKGIKLLNGINHTHGTWEGNCLTFEKTADELANNITDIISRALTIQDSKPLKQVKNLNDITELKPNDFVSLYNHPHIIEIKEQQKFKENGKTYIGVDDGKPVRFFRDDISTLFREYFVISSNGIYEDSFAKSLPHMPTSEDTFMDFIEDTLRELKDGKTINIRYDDENYRITAKFSETIDGYDYYNYSLSTSGITRNNLDTWADVYHLIIDKQFFSTRNLMTTAIEKIEEDYLSFIKSNDLTLHTNQFKEIKEVKSDITTKIATCQILGNNLIEYLNSNSFNQALNEAFERVASTIYEQSNSVKINGYNDTWYVIDAAEINDEKLFVLENEKYGNKVACLIVDVNGQVKLDNVWNGFDDYTEYLETQAEIEQACEDNEQLADEDELECGE